MLGVGIGVARQRLVYITEEAKPSQKRIDPRPVIQTYHWTPDTGCTILPAMIAQHYRLYIERQDAGRNMARFYALSIEETLFGQMCLVRRWGRIGTAGRTVQHSFDSERQAVELFLELLRAKRLRGYRPRSATAHAEVAPSG